MQTNNFNTKWYHKILKSKKFWALFIITTSIFVEFISSFIYHHYSNTSDYMELLYYTTQIVSSMFVVGGVVVAVWQYYLSCQDARTNLEIVQVQRAIDLSEYYKDNILRYLPAIYYIFDHSGATEILHSVHLDQLHHFDKYELERLLSQEEINKLKELLEKPQFLQAVIEANEIYNLNLKFRQKIEFNRGAEDHEVTVYVDVHSVVITFLSRLINQVLNNMEFFALHFRHKTADESVVYQSLHQTYLKAIGYLYYYISIYNEDPTDKLYTNVTWLYLAWYEEQQKQDIDRLEKNDAIQRHGTVIGNHN